MSSITNYIRIHNNRIFKGEECIFRSQGDTFTSLADQFYGAFKTNYPKFHKMDSLSKLGFIGAELLLADRNLASDYSPDETGVILANKSASLDTDIRHQRIINTGPASPSVFVYSLPNIVIGEICIRHGIKGENTFFVDREYDIPAQVRYVQFLMSGGYIKACIGGWVELFENNYNAFMYLTENNAGNNAIPFTTYNLTKLFNTDL